MRNRSLAPWLLSLAAAAVLVAPVQADDVPATPTVRAVTLHVTGMT